VGIPPYGLRGKLRENPPTEGFWTSYRQKEAAAGGTEIPDKNIAEGNLGKINKIKKAKGPGKR